jgi:hypothetical protein
VGIAQLVLAPRRSEVRTAAAFILSIWRC